VPPASRYVLLLAGAKMGEFNVTVPAFCMNVTNENVPPFHVNRELGAVSEIVPAALSAPLSSEYRLSAPMLSVPVTLWTEEGPVWRNVPAPPAALSSSFPITLSVPVPLSK
jgi:hypothetical protein